MKPETKIINDEIIVSERLGLAYQSERMTTFSFEKGRQYPGSLFKALTAPGYPVVPSSMVTLTQNCTAVSYPNHHSANQSLFILG